MENKEKNDRNCLRIFLITVSALFLLFAIFYKIVNGETLDTFSPVPPNTAQANILEMEGGSDNINIDF